MRSESSSDGRKHQLENEVPAVFYFILNFAESILHNVIQNS